jgi:hypothetical protein
MYLADLPASLKITAAWPVRNNVTRAPLDLQQQSSVRAPAFRHRFC